MDALWGSWGATMEQLSLGLEILITAIALPWMVFVTVSIFNQRQEIAVMRMELKNSKDIYELLKERLT